MNRNGKLEKDVFLVTALILIVIWCASCMAGGSSGTGMRYGSGRKTSAPSGVEYLTIHGTLHGDQSLFRSSITLKAETEKHSETTSVSRAGAFSIFVIRKNREPVSLLFTDTYGREWRTDFYGSLRDGDALDCKFAHTEVFCNLR